MGSEQKSPGQRCVDGGNTDSRGRVTGESAEETAGGNHPYQSPHGQLISPSTRPLSKWRSRQALLTPRPEELPRSASMLSVDLRVEADHRASEGELVFHWVN